MEAPISVSMKLGDIGNLFRRVVDAAQRPHLSIPETELGRTHKQYRRLLNRSLTVAAGQSGRAHCSGAVPCFLVLWCGDADVNVCAVGAAVLFVGVTAYRVYSLRTQHVG